MAQPLILDGRVVAKSIEADLQKRVEIIKEKSGITPVLATIIVGNNPASETYVRMKGNACKRVGMEPKKIELPESTTTEELLSVIDELNRDDSVCGILLQHPVPKHIDEQKCFNAISLDKDTDGVNTASFGAVTMGNVGFKCATPYSIMTILNYYGIELKGKHAVVIGRSPILGKPVSMLLLNADATVTICHSRTVNLPEIVKTADVVVACVGKANFVKREWLKEGVVLVDAGYNEGNVGDIDLQNAAEISSAYTPVPGGVGPCTIAMLMSQTVESAERKYL
ncbi:MAG: bifunctional methylenetetrahydrofolate dehydrogenase/methenyltetrahydrofolate cyclohydrolase [Clostridia bacterium]|nr:bifunctional methylenetetrahydrofolate dehydrogenase/methenyltetrahydrofolate cyclohydrolase [Clostridia bacterium]